MKLEDARPLSEFCEEELIRIQNFLNQSGEDPITIRHLFDEFIIACDNYAYKEFAISDFSRKDEKRKRKLSTSKGISINDFVCTYSKRAIQRWNPKVNTKFTTFLYSFLNTPRKIDESSANIRDVELSRVVQYVCSLLKKEYPDKNPNDYYQDKFYYDSPYIIKSVSKLFYNLSDKEIREKANDIVAKFLINKIQFPAAIDNDDNLSSEDIVTVKNSEFDESKDIADILIENSKNEELCRNIDKTLSDMEEWKLLRKDSKEKLAMLITAYLWEGNKSFCKQDIIEYSKKYDCITSDYGKLFEFEAVNHKVPTASDIAKMYGVGKSAISNIWKKFLNFAKKMNFSV